MTYRLPCSQFTAALVGALLAIPAVHAADPAATTNATTSDPKDVCNAMVDAAKKDDFKTFQNLSWEWTMGGHHGEEGSAKEKKVEKKEELGFHQMHAQELSRLKDLKCGSAHVAGNTAIVETETQGEKRLIPFIQREGTWKFDPRTYMSLYRDSMHQLMKEHGKEGKKDAQSKS